MVWLEREHRHRLFVHFFWRQKCQQPFPNHIPDADTAAAANQVSSATDWLFSAAVGLTWPSAQAAASLWSVWLEQPCRVASKTFPWFYCRRKKIAKTRLRMITQESLCRFAFIADLRRRQTSDTLGNNSLPCINHYPPPRALQQQNNRVSLPAWSLCNTQTDNLRFCRYVALKCTSRLLHNLLSNDLDGWPGQFFTHVLSRWGEIFFFLSSKSHVFDGFGLHNVKQCACGHSRQLEEKTQNWANNIFSAPDWLIRCCNWTPLTAADWLHWRRRNPIGQLST